MTYIMLHIFICYALYICSFAHKRTQIVLPCLSFYFSSFCRHSVKAICSHLARTQQRQSQGLTTVTVKRHYHSIVSNSYICPALSQCE